MRIMVGLESENEGRSLAWALDSPGCFAYGKDDAEAILRLPQALVGYAARISQRAAKPWLDLGDFDVRVVETRKVYFLDENYDLASEGNEINAWFHHDWKPLARIEIEQGLQLLKWNREDLLGIARGLDHEQLNREHAGERWTVRGILKHIGGSEWWYLDRLGLTDLTHDTLPSDPFERLNLVRASLEQVLPHLEGQEMVRGKEGEFWSPRKLLRRALWHEMDHIDHILKLLTA